MVIKVYISMISCSQETKKNQQRCLMILESKNIPFVTIDITDPSQEESRDYMIENAQPKGDNKVPGTPQLFNEATYCGDFEDLDSANECDEIGEFLKLTSDELKGVKIGITGILPKADGGAGTDETPEAPLTNGMSTNNQEDVQEQPKPILEKDPLTDSQTQQEGETTSDPSVGAPEITSNEEEPSPLGVTEESTEEPLIEEAEIEASEDLCGMGETSSDPYDGSPETITRVNHVEEENVEA